MPVGQFPAPKPNKLIAAMQLLFNKQPIGQNKLFPGQSQHYLGTWLLAEPADANLSVVRLQGGATMHFVPKSTSQTFVAGDVVKLEKSSVLPLHITGKMVGNISLAGTQVNVSPPGVPTSYHTTSGTSTTENVAWTAGADHFGAGLSYNIYLNGTYKQTTAVGVTSATISGLKSGTHYTSYIVAVDGAGNTSPTSSTISWDTTGAPGGDPGSSVSKTYSATKLYSYNYNGGHERNSWHDGAAYQGVYGSGNQLGLIQFPWSTMAADLSGHEPTQAVLYITYAHWWAGAGGTAVIGTHNYSSIPTSTFSFDHTNNNRWHPHSNAGSRMTVTMGNTVADEIKSGATKGICIGQGLTTGTTYYGYTYGLGSHVPQIKLTWTV